MENSELKTEMQNSIGQKRRNKKLVLFLLSFIALCAILGLGMEYWDKTERQRHLSAIRNAERLPDNLLNEQAVNGDPYAMYAWGQRLLEMAKAKCKWTGMYGRTVGYFDASATSPDVVNTEEFNKAGQFLLHAAESAKANADHGFLRMSGGFEFERVTNQALRRWQMDAQSFKAPILQNPEFMRRVVHVLDE